MAVSFQCMTKSTTINKKEKKKRSTSFKNHQNELCCLPNGFHWPHETHPGFKMEVGTKVKQITF